MVNDIFEGPFVEFWNNYACGSPHDEHRSSGPRKVKLCLDQYNFVIKELPYLGLHNAQDFAQILYLVGGVCIINRNNVFHSFPDREITCLPCCFVYYCQHAKLNIS